MKDTPFGTPAGASNAPSIAGANFGQVQAAQKGDF